MNPFIYATEPVAGIDYSLRSPCICIIKPYVKNEVIVPFEMCEWHYLTYQRSAVVDKGNIHGTLVGQWRNESERYETIAEWAVGVVSAANVSSVGLEDYAYGAADVTRLTQLAENAGLLKYFLYKAGKAVDLYSPTAIKKFATSKGNSNKEKMYDAWLEDTRICLNSIFGRHPDAKLRNPVTDIVDAYYVALSQRVEMVAQNGHPNNRPNNQKESINEDNSTNDIG